MKLDYLIERLNRLRLEHGNLDVMKKDSMGYLDLDFGALRLRITEQDAENCGACEGKVGEWVIGSG